MPMKVFLSWSGDWSERIATELAHCLKLVLRVKPFLSSRDIRSGSQWYEVIARELGETKYGIVCLTPENLMAPWILFEGGALAKTAAEVETKLTARGEALRKNYLCPYLIGGLKSSEITGPLSQYFWKEATPEGTLALFKDINSVVREVEGTDAALGDAELTDAFGRFFPELEKLLGTPPAVPEPKMREVTDYLEEILGLVRGLAQSGTAASYPIVRMDDIRTKGGWADIGTLFQRQLGLRDMLSISPEDNERLAQFRFLLESNTEKTGKQAAPAKAKAEAEKPAAKVGKPIAKKSE